MIRAAIFDLDGVLVDTAKFHYQAWKRLAKELGFDFAEQDNERLKGVSRMRSLDILLEVGSLSFPEAEKEAMAAKKNAWYVDMLQTLNTGDLLPGARETLEQFRALGVCTVLGSASKNSPLILEKLEIHDLFDAIIDGNRTQRAKPDPEVFLLGAQDVGVLPTDCVVFEDALAGIEAAHAARMLAVGVGESHNLPGADYLVPSLSAFDVDAFMEVFSEKG